MATKFFTSSVKILNDHSLEDTTLCLQWDQNFYQIKIKTMMKHYDESVKINHNLNWPFVPDYPYRIWIIGGLGSGKPMLLNLIKHQRPDID